VGKEAITGYETKTKRKINSLKIQEKFIKEK